MFIHAVDEEANGFCPLPWEAFCIITNPTPIFHHFFFTASAVEHLAVYLQEFCGACLIIAAPFGAISKYGLLPHQGELTGA